MQAASASASAANPTWASRSIVVPGRRAKRAPRGYQYRSDGSRMAHCDIPHSLLAAPAAHSLAIGELYLLRSRRFDPRATASSSIQPRTRICRPASFLRFEACHR